jgi:hypothetical protein
MLLAKQQKHQTVVKHLSAKVQGIPLKNCVSYVMNCFYQMMWLISFCDVILPYWCMKRGTFLCTYGIMWKPILQEETPEPNS